MSDGEKTCVLCGQSCAGQARIKNQQGRYAHKACVSAKQERGAEAAEQDGLSHEGLDDLFDDIEVIEVIEQSGIGPGVACPGCGQPMDVDAVVCMGCGHNRESGQRLKTKASKDRVAKENAVGSAGSEFMGSVMSQVLFPIIGGCAGGVAGAGLWAVIAFYGQIRLGLFAWGVGALVGLGVNLGSRDTGGVFYGLIASVLAVGSVVGGHYITASLLVDQYLEMLEPEDVTDEMAMGIVVWDVIEEWTLRGEEVPWPRKWRTWELALWPEDFSRVIIAETQVRWDSMEFDDQVVIKTDIASVTRANSQFIEHEMIETGFLYLLKRPMNIVYLVLAVISAFLVAARD